MRRRTPVAKLDLWREDRLRKLAKVIAFMEQDQQAVYYSGPQAPPRIDAANAFSLRRLWVGSSKAGIPMHFEHGTYYYAAIADYMDVFR